MRAGPAGVLAWLERLDPGSHRRIKGLRLVTAFGMAAMLASQPAVANSVASGPWLGSLAGGIALWASVSEGQATRAASSRDLVLLCAAGAAGAAGMALLTPVLAGVSMAGPELVLVSGAFLVGYLRSFGVLGAGLGSQVFIGQLLAYGAGLGPADLPVIMVAALIAALSSVVPRVLSGPAEHPPTSPTLAAPAGVCQRPGLLMGLQAAIAALLLTAMNAIFGLEQSAWAITASTYVIANSTAGTWDRVRRRIVGTTIGLPIGIACLPLAVHAPILLWAMAAVAMVAYAMALPERYDVACGAFAFTLIVTLAISGEHSIALFAARAWETLLGAALGLAAAMLLPVDGYRRSHSS